MNRQKKMEDRFYNGLYKKGKGQREKWEKPTLEDVSSKVMAQPYIRFT